MSSRREREAQARRRARGGVIVQHCGRGVCKCADCLPGLRVAQASRKRTGQSPQYAKAKEPRIVAMAERAARGESLFGGPT